MAAIRLTAPKVKCTRVPLLDRQLVALLLKYPTVIKTDGQGQPKPLLAKALEGMLPSMVLDRRDKQGFTFPFDTWLRQTLSDKLVQSGNATKQSNLFNPQAFNQIRDRFLQGKLHWSRPWAVTALQNIV